MHWGSRQKRWLAAIAVLLVIWYFRQPLWQTLLQLFYGMLAAFAALPLMRLLERKCKPGLAASLSMTGLSAILIAAVLLLLPALAAQGRQLVALLPSVTEKVAAWIRQGEAWLSQNGMPVNEALRQSMGERGRDLLSSAAPAVIGWAQQTVGGLSRWMLAPVFGFYFLRDRRLIGEWLLLLLPVGKRSATVQLLREIRREIAGYLRGQLMISLAVGGLTAACLLLCGIPAWLLLGVLMGVLELIPYVGPFIGGVAVLLFSLEAGFGRMLWAMGTVLLVQQLEGSWLSPKMMSDATRLHPVAVLLCIMLGGAVGGISGILLAVPAALCARAALRIYSLNRTERMRSSPAYAKER